MEEEIICDSHKISNIEKNQFSYQKMAQPLLYENIIFDEKKKWNKFWFLKNHWEILSSFISAPAVTRLTVYRRIGVMET